MSVTVQPQGKTASPAAKAIRNTDTSRGTTTVADGVVAKVAGIAAQDIPGVYGGRPNPGGR